MNALPDISTEDLPGVYLEVTSRPGAALDKEKLDKSDLTLLRYTEGVGDNKNQESATVFATEKGLKQLRKKVEQYKTENTKDQIQDDGSIKPGRPKNAALVQSIGAIARADLLELWRSPRLKFPEGEDRHHWEVWLHPATAEDFVQKAASFDVAVGSDRLVFPDDVVVVAQASIHDLAMAVRKIAGVRSLAIPSATAEFFASLDPIDQEEWLKALLDQAEFTEPENAGYVTLLDTGVNRNHPLLQPVLHPDDLHAAKPAWDKSDVKGHGTEMAGLAIYGDLTTALQTRLPMSVVNRLESVKLLPDRGRNLHDMLGLVTRKAVDVVEAFHEDRRRTFSMAVTTVDDTPHDGAPTSWSTEVDQIISGISGTVRTSV